VGEEEFEIVGETVGEELRARAVHEFTMRWFVSRGRDSLLGIGSLTSSYRQWGTLPVTGIPEFWTLMILVSKANQGF